MIQLLERIGTADARQLLQTLASGDPDAPLKKEAKAAFDRLRRRNAAP
jgi:hypothetical protein